MQVIRANAQRFRLCYEQGVWTPSFQGRVVVKFVISTDGTVSSAAESESYATEAAVVDCLVRTVAGLSFPRPEGGSVRVTYPFTLAVPWHRPEPAKTAPPVSSPAKRP